MEVYVFDDAYEAGRVTVLRVSKKFAEKRTYQRLDYHRGEDSSDNGR